MTVLAWLADSMDARDEDRGLGTPDHEVIDAAVNWVDETLAIIRAEEARGDAGARDQASTRPGDSAPAWLDLAR
jgi:hypothetical protein